MNNFLFWQIPLSDWLQALLIVGGVYSAYYLLLFIGRLIREKRMAKKHPEFHEKPMVPVAIKVEQNALARLEPPDRFKGSSIEMRLRRPPLRSNPLLFPRKTGIATHKDGKSRIYVQVPRTIAGSER